MSSRPYSVYQHWDPLRVCLVGRSYPPEFYSFIDNARARDVMTRIAQETEEDYLALVRLLETFKVEVLRPDVPKDWQLCYSRTHNRIMPPPMTPRDISIMLGEDFYLADLGYHFDTQYIDGKRVPPAGDPLWCAWNNVVDKIRATNAVHDAYHANVDYSTAIFCGAMTTRCGRDIYIGTQEKNHDRSHDIRLLKQRLPQYRCHIIDTGGHNDGLFCPVTPGLIISLCDVSTYEKTFPDWEVIYLPNQSWDKVQPFLELKQLNQGRWWVPGEELNTDFIEYVQTWFDHWVGYVEETVFDVNMLVIDQHNVICNGYNEQVFRALERYDITAHVMNFRHRYFWDGGLHCITSDVDRLGSMQDYFPWRG